MIFIKINNKDFKDYKFLKNLNCKLFFLESKFNLKFDNNFFIENFKNL